MSWYQWQGEQLIITLRVQPRASRDEIVGPYGDGANGDEGEALKVRIPKLLEDADFSMPRSTHI